MISYKNARKFTRTANFITVLIVAIVFIGIGSFIIFSRLTKEYEKCDAVITSIETQYDSDNNEFYSANIKYIVSGVEYNGSVGASSSDRAGDSITVEYEKGNPEAISNGGFIYVGYMLVVFGLVFIIFAVIKKRKSFKVEDEVLFGPNDSIAESANQNFADNLGGLEDYYFRFTSQMKPAYVMETLERTPIYEAKSNNFTLLRPYNFKFTNYISGYSKNHSVSHTVNTETGFNVAFVEMSAKFKLDGISIFEVLNLRHLKISYELVNFVPHFQIYRGEEKIAHIIQGGANILKENKNYGKRGNLLTIPGVYKISCANENIDDVFLCAFALARLM